MKPTSPILTTFLSQNGQAGKRIKPTLLFFETQLVCAQTFSFFNLYLEFWIFIEISRFILAIQKFS